MATSSGSTSTATPPADGTCPAPPSPCKMPPAAATTSGRPTTADTSTESAPAHRPHDRNCQRHTPLTDRPDAQQRRLHQPPGPRGSGGFIGGTPVAPVLLAYRPGLALMDEIAGDDNFETTGPALQPMVEMLTGLQQAL